MQLSKVSPEFLWEEKKKSQYCAACQALLMQREDLKPPEPFVNVLFPYIGWGSVLVGVVVLACGMKGLYDYGQIQPVVAEFAWEDPPGPFRLYLTHGLFPTLQALFGMFAAIAGSLYLKMRPGARKVLMAAAWSDIALAVTSELFNFIVSIRASSSHSSLSYLVEFIGFVMMTTFWTVPLLALIWFLRKDFITTSSLLNSIESIFKSYRRIY